jgi:hypothetical protein
MLVLLTSCATLLKRQTVPVAPLAQECEPLSEATHSQHSDSEIIDQTPSKAFVDVVKERVSTSVESTSLQGNKPQNGQNLDDQNFPPSPLQISEPDPNANTCKKPRQVVPNRVFESIGALVAEIGSHIHIPSDYSGSIDVQRIVNLEKSTRQVSREPYIALNQTESAVKTSAHLHNAPVPQPPNIYSPHLKCREQNPSASEDERLPNPNISHGSPIDADGALKIDHVSRQLAGLEPIHLSTELVENFRQLTTQGWNNLKRTVFEPLAKWRRRALPAFRSKRVFYPFGGPDAAYVTQFFPDSAVYILIGLESVGSVESARKILSHSDHLKLFSRSVEHFLKKGYFVTSYMGSQLSSTKVGVVPVILSQLAQLGFEILDVKTVGISSDGVICSEKDGLLNSVQIRFRSAAGEKTMFYFRCSLENENQEKVTTFLKFVGGEKFVTFVKSGAYRLYDTKLFSNVRTFILDNSEAILQDDTGIPHHFLTETFDIKLFGQYKKPPLKEFHAYHQQDLATAYETKSVWPLPFGIGYGNAKVESNLLLAISTRAEFR